MNECKAVIAGTQTGLGVVLYATGDLLVTDVEHYNGFADEMRLESRHGLWMWEGEARLAGAGDQEDIEYIGKLRPLTPREKYLVSTNQNPWQDEKSQAVNPAKDYTFAELLAMREPAKYAIEKLTEALEHIMKAMHAYIEKHGTKVGTDAWIIHESGEVYYVTGLTWQTVICCKLPDIAKEGTKE